MNNNITFVYFGTPEFSRIILDELKEAGFTPSLVITAPDRPVGRKRILTPPAVKVWADENNIECWQVAHPREIAEQLEKRSDDLYIVASYGYIVSQRILDIPKHGVLNVHTSLLPKYRGASPIESAILHGDKETGSTIMKMSLGMDEGDILAQTHIPLDNKITKPELFDLLAHDGGKLLSKTITSYVQGEIKSIPQDHKKASYCKKLSKSDANLSNISSDKEKWLRYRAFYGWPGSFVMDGDLRLKITKASFQEGKFIIEKIIPAGKKELDFNLYIGNRAL